MDLFQNGRSNRGKRQALALFDFLAGLIPPSGIGRQNTSFEPELALRAYANTRVTPGAKPGSLILLSDLMNDGWMEGLRALASRGFEISVIHILSPGEANPVAPPPPTPGGRAVLAPPVTNELPTDAELNEGTAARDLK